MTVPFGLTTDYDGNFLGRFQSKKAELQTIDVNPSIAYKVNDMVSLGAGFSYQKADLTLERSFFMGAERFHEDETQPVLLPVPAWITAVHVLFMAWTVLNSHYPGLFVGGFLFFLGFARATAPYQSPLDLRAPLLVGFFLGGLVIHGGLQAWWIAPLLGSLSVDSLFAGCVILTAFNDNALVTYLATLVPDLSEASKLAIVEGAVAGGGLTVIADAPNPAGQALLGRFFDGAIHPFFLFAGALVPTLITIAAFRLL